MAGLSQPLGGRRRLMVGQEGTVDLAGPVDWGVKAELVVSGAVATRQLKAARGDKAERGA